MLVGYPIMSINLGGCTHSLSRRRFRDVLNHLNSVNQTCVLVSFSHILFCFSIAFDVVICSIQLFYDICIHRVMSSFIECLSICVINMSLLQSASLYVCLSPRGFRSIVGIFDPILYLWPFLYLWYYPILCIFDLMMFPHLVVYSSLFSLWVIC
jgi:hypothetical protein